MCFGTGRRLPGFLLELWASADSGPGAEVTLAAVTGGGDGRARRGCQEAARRQQCDHHADGSRGAERRGRAQTGAGGSRPDECGDDPADGERGVERRHDRPVVALLHVHGVGVHAHVQAAVPEAEHEQRTGQLPRVFREARQREGHGAEHCGGRNHDPRAESVGEAACDLHAEEGAEPEQHQQAAERRVTDVHALFDGGNLHQPHAHQGAVEDEVDEGRDAGGPE